MKKAFKQVNFCLLQIGLIVAVTVITQCASAAGETIITSDNPNGWFFIQETSTGSGTFVYGPYGPSMALPPLGGGSAQFTVNATGGELFGTFAFAGTRLDAIPCL